MKLQQESSHLTPTQLPSHFAGMPSVVLFHLARYLSGRDTLALICTARGFAILREDQHWQEKIAEEFLCVTRSFYPQIAFCTLFDDHYTFDASQQAQKPLPAHAHQFNEHINKTLSKLNPNERLSPCDLHALLTQSNQAAAKGELTWLQNKMAEVPALRAAITQLHQEQYVSNKLVTPLRLALGNGHTALALSLIGSDKTSKLTQQSL